VRLFVLVTARNWNTLKNADSQCMTASGCHQMNLCCSHRASSTLSFRCLERQVGNNDECTTSMTPTYRVERCISTELKNLYTHKNNFHIHCYLTGSLVPWPNFHQSWTRIVLSHFDCDVTIKLHDWWKFGHGTFEPVSGNSEYGKYSYVCTDSSVQ